MAHYLFNFVKEDAAKGPALLVPMDTVLSQIDPPGNAKADFQAGVVRITANEYETARAVATERAPSTD